MTIAMVDGERPERKANERLIRGQMEMLCTEADLVTPEPGDCEQSPLPGNPQLAFVAVNSPRELQLLRQIARFNPQTSLAIISTSPEYGVEGIRYGVKHYLMEPLDRGELTKALLDGISPREGPE